VRIAFAEQKRADDAEHEWFRHVLLKNRLPPDFLLTHLMRTTTPTNSWKHARFATMLPGNLKFPENMLLQKDGFPTKGSR
jgi:hypothetical protein